MTFLPRNISNDLLFESACQFTVKIKLKYKPIFIITLYTLTN